MQNCKANEEFEEKKLKEEFSFIENAVEASFFRSRNSNTTAVLFTFNLQENPYNIYIPGQPSDTAVHKHLDRPMICHSCYKYRYK